MVAKDKRFISPLASLRPPPTSLQSTCPSSSSTQSLRDPSGSSWPSYNRWVSLPLFSIHRFTWSDPESPPGPSLLCASTATNIHVPEGPDLPTYLPCTFPQSNSSSPSIPLSHVLAIRSTDSSRTLLLPTHGLLWAAKCPGLSILSSSPTLQPPSSFLPPTRAPAPSSLPILELSLPSSLAVPLLQGWLYLASPSILLSSLLPTLHAPSASASLSEILNLPASHTEALSYLPSAKLLERVALVHGLWQDTVALEILDEALWKTMRVAWNLLVGALATREKRRAGEAVPEEEVRS